jgi:thioredoxin reductase
MNNNDNRNFEVIIIGGSYSGLAAGMTLGRALRKVLIIDSGKPCNKHTPYSHNFLIADGMPPEELAATARQHIARYKTVQLLQDVATEGKRFLNRFTITTQSGNTFTAKKLIFATGISDILPGIQGLTECWGKSVLHCPYCHGYEVKGLKTGILGDGESVIEFASLISNWTNDLTIYTNGISTLSVAQKALLHKHNIRLCEMEIQKLIHTNGSIEKVVFTNGEAANINALYIKPNFAQHCNIPILLGCATNADGYIVSDASQNTTVPGIFACGDNVTRMRTLANAVAMGTTAGMSANKELVIEKFAAALQFDSGDFFADR